MAIHPDDPPWNIFGLPRIITSKANLERFIQLHPSKHNGLTMCSGSLGSDKKNDFPDMLTYFGKKGRVHFVQDRKSTRLNSSHVSISYAVFCLKKKIQIQ